MSILTKRWDFAARLGFAFMAGAWVALFGSLFLLASLLSIGSLALTVPAAIQAKFTLQEREAKA